MITIRDLALGTVLLMAGGQACSADPQNPLLGAWTAEPNGYVDSQGFEFCKVTPRMEFTPTTQTMFSATAQGTTDVSYLVSGNTVYVSSTPSFLDAPKYIILGPNEIQAASVGNCKYTRE